MRDAVRKAFVPMTISLEGGFITWMFPDVLGLVSTGFGLLLEPPATAMALPWKRADGSLAAREEIMADWLAVKNFPDAARLGHKSVEHIAKLRLDNEGLFQAFQGKINQNELVLRQGFPEWDEWSADAQLATLSMAWADGAGFWDPHAGPHHHWPHLTQALREKDFLVAAVECFMAQEITIGGLRPRNKANRILYRNAAYAMGAGLDPDVLFYPRDLSASDADRIPDTVPAPIDSVTIVDQPIVHPSIPLGRDDE